MSFKFLSLSPGLALYNGIVIGGATINFLTAARSWLYTSPFTTNLYSMFDGRYAADFPGHFNLFRFAAKIPSSVDTSALDVVEAPALNFSAAPQIFTTPTAKPAVVPQLPPRPVAPKRVPAPVVQPAPAARPLIVEDEEPITAPEPAPAAAPALKTGTQPLPPVQAPVTQPLWTPATLPQAPLLSPAGKGLPQYSTEKQDLSEKGSE